MRAWHVIAAALLVLGGLAGDTPLTGGQAAPEPALPPYLADAPAPPGYRLVWSDEFTGPTLDSTKWNVRDNQNYGASMRQDQCYRAANVAQYRGKLHIRVKRQRVTCGGTNPDTGTPTYSFTSGFLTTRANQGRPQRFAFTKGYAEAAIRLPRGNAYWAGFWHTGGGGAPAWPAYGEFDTMEQVGAYPDSVIQTLHYRCASSPCRTTDDNVYDVRTGAAERGARLTDDGAPAGTTARFVRYGLLWDDEKIVWYVDGVPVRSFDGTRLRRYAVTAHGVVVAHVSRVQPAVLPSWRAVLDTSHVIDVNLAYGGTLPRQFGYTGHETATGYDDGNFTGTRPGVMDVDYVRVYQLE